MDDLIEAKRPAMVVAHPDDEAMWGAGLLLRYPKNWDVICCTTPERDPERAELFFKSCAVLGVNPVLIRQPENLKIDFNKIDLEPYDLIVTHNRDGEYGHRQHKEVNAYISEKYPEKTVCFGYRPRRSSVPDFEIELTPDECKKKMAAIQCYDNIGSSNRPTWVMLLEAFGHKFDLWREPYEWALRMAPIIPMRGALMQMIDAVC